jgi:hypothetical protein
MPSPSVTGSADEHAAFTVPQMPGTGFLTGVRQDETLRALAATAVRRIETGK